MRWKLLEFDERSIKCISVIGTFGWGSCWVLGPSIQFSVAVLFEFHFVSRDFKRCSFVISTETFVVEKTTE